MSIPISLMHQSNSISSIVRLSIRGYRGTESYYRITIPSVGKQSRTYLLSSKLFGRLSKRYFSVMANSHSISSSVSNVASTTVDSCLYEMPGETSSHFMKAVIDALSRKQSTNAIIPNWIAPSSLYKLWLLSCHVSTEMFADCFNESGMLAEYCSADVMDKEFAALGTWESVEKKIEGGGGNPPFHKDFLEGMMCRFEEGVHGVEPYCRVVILPIGNRYGVMDHVDSIISEGELLLSAPPGSFPFMNEQVLLSRNHLKPKPSRHQSVGIVVWVNRQYLLKHRIPSDIEDLYLAWVHEFLQNANNVVLHRDAFLRAFPQELRSSESILSTYVQEIANDH